MKYFPLLLVLFKVLSVTTSFAQKQPINLARETFVVNDSTKRTSKRISVYDSVSFDIAYQNKTDATIKMVFYDSAKVKSYHALLFSKKQDWELVGHKVFKPTDALWLKNRIEKFSEKQLDSIARDHKKTFPFNFSSKEDIQIALRRLKLALSTDEEIIAHFKQNEEKFETVCKRFFLSHKNEYPVSYYSRTVMLEPDFIAAYHQLLIYFIHDKGEKNNEYIEFEIGGSNGCFVGYLYIPYGRDIPQIISERFIIIQKIDRDWYFFRTM